MERCTLGLRVKEEKRGAVHTGGEGERGEERSSAHWR